jgi:hypothetical protein
MARIKNVHLAREVYDDVDTAVKELGTLWVLDRINSGLTYSKKRAQDMREKRAKEE